MMAQPDSLRISPQAPQPGQFAQANLARQPILNADLKTVGYELLFRDGPSNTARFDDGNRATSTVLASAIAEFGLDTVVGSLPAWVNFTAQYLLDELPIPIAPKGLVIELLEDAQPNDELVQRLRELVKQGYRIALDDFRYRAEHRDLIEAAQVVKIDVLGRPLDDVANQVREFKRYNVQLLAEKVEQMSDFEAYRKMGFALFQGYFVCRPQLIQQKRPPANRVALIRLMSELFVADPNINKIRELVQQDVTLSYRLLKWLNSSLFALPHPVESIQQALVMLGINRLRNLVCLIVLARIDDRPSILVETALMRARIGERIAPHFGIAPEMMFTVGLFSILDALIGMPMSQILENMPLSADVAAAITDRSGACGRALAGIQAHENGDWKGVAEAGLDLEILTPAWVDAIVWVRGIRNMMSSGGAAVSAVRKPTRPT
jgi:EAL and modified HD-GYP domain-containing signal transduction protein